MEGIKILTIVIELIIAALSGMAIITVMPQLKTNVRKLSKMDYAMMLYIVLVLFNCGINLYNNL